MALPSLLDPNSSPSVLPSAVAGGLPPIPQLVSDPSSNPIAQQPSAIPQLSSGGLRPLVTNPRQQQEEQLQQSLLPKPGQPGFWHALGRVASKIGNVAGDILDPGAMSIIPGTDLYNHIQHQQNQNLLTSLQKQDQADQDDASRRNLEGANAAHLEQETENAAKPPAETWKPVEGYIGPKGEPMEYSEQTGTYRVAPLAPGSEGVQAKAPKLPEGEMPLKNADNLNSALQDRFQVLHPGQELPSQYKLPPNATQKDYDRIDKSLEGVERATGTHEQQQQSQALRMQAAALAQQNRGDKQDTAQRQTVYKTYAPAMDSAERFNVMTKNYEEAVKNNNQQAMLSLLYNHLGMTMGLQKGARMSQQVIQEAQKSQPWLQGIKAQFDKDGYLSGVTLGPQQMRDMVSLAQERYGEDIGKARNEAGYLGATDDGPKRTPNESTMRYYLNLSKGNVPQAKQMAAKDGWTVVQ